jgi:hypothetical protein
LTIEKTGICFSILNWKSEIVNLYAPTSSIWLLRVFPPTAPECENKGGRAGISGNSRANVRNANNDYARAPQILAFAWLWLSCNFLPQ